MSVTVDCGEGRHDACVGSGTEHYLFPQLNDGDEFECACTCHNDREALRIERDAARAALRGD